MTAVIPVSVEWLTLREEADARSRSRRLSAAAVQLLPSPAVIHDLGSGTGSMMRWLAPRVAGPQTWVLHDWNPDLLESAVAHATVGSAAAERADTLPASVRTRVREVAHLQSEVLVDASLVTASALLDVLTAAELETIVHACVGARAPVLFTLTVTGAVAFDPVDPGDLVFTAAFNEHQRRVEDGRRLLGPDAVAVATDLFRAAGWTVRTADSPWDLDAHDRLLVQEWLDGWLAAAVEQRPALREWADEYQRLRAVQLATGALRVTVAHRDLRAWPP